MEFHSNMQWWIKREMKGVAPQNEDPQTYSFGKQGTLVRGLTLFPLASAV